MTTPSDQPLYEISADVLLRAYACGIFPMAESADDPNLYWIDPDHRGALPLDAIHLSRRLARTIRQRPFDVRIDTDYHAIIDGCAAPSPDRQSTWINTRIRELYGDLFASGHCHTIEVYQDDKLVGGLYGVALKGAFFGESMFSTERDASKVALMYLCARLITGGFSLLDTQFITGHLKSFGAEEIPRSEFHTRLNHALMTEADFNRLAPDAPPDEIIRIIRDNAHPDA